MIVKYREHVFIDNYKCIDNTCTIRFIKCWKANNLLYGYIDRFNIKSIAIKDIISTEGSF